MYAHICQRSAINLRQQFCNAVCIGLAPHKPEVRMPARDGCKMFPAAEPNFKGKFLCSRKERFEVQRSFGQDHCRQEPLDKLLLVATQRPSDAPPIKLASPRSNLDQAKALFNCETRSVRSQENPPSGSGALPKCPYADVRA